MATGTDPDRPASRFPDRDAPAETASAVAGLGETGPLQGGGAPDWRIWLGLGITLAWLILGALYIDAGIGWSRIAEQPAEVIGNFLEGAFAPLAFLWLVIGYFLQQKELAQNTDALRLQFREIQRSAEQAVIQSRTIARSEIHSRQETFLKISERVRGQLGAIIGLLYVSSQGANGAGRVSPDEMASLWSELNKGDPDTFSRRMLELHASEQDPTERMALFYGTEIRARHTNNFIFTFERLLQRAREADTDGILEDAIVGSAHGLVYRLARGYQKIAPEHLADISSTGRDVRLGGMVPAEPLPANDATGDSP